MADGFRFSAIFWLVAAFAAAATPAMSQPSDDRVFRVLMHAGDQDERLKFSVREKEGYSSRIEVATCPDLDDPILKDTARNTMELMFICHSLRRSDIADAIQLVAIPNPSRALTMLANGHADAFGNSLPLGDLADHHRTLLVSDPVLKDNQFFVGLFTTRNRNDVLAARTREQIRALRGITVRSWSGDVRTMTELPFADVVMVPQYELISSMIENNRADITFANLERDIVHWGEPPMKRLNGFKVALLGTRHMIVSPERAEFFEQLQSFLRESRGAEPDRILEAYYHSSFLSRDYDDWEVLTTEPGRHRSN